MGRLFLTGASGYLGRHLLDTLAGTGFDRIYCLTRSGSLPDREEIQWLRGDLEDPATYMPQLAECETLVHLAAATGKSSRNEYFKVNQLGTERLIQAAKACGVRNLLHVSTIAVKFARQSKYYYAQSKRLAEQAVAASGLRYTILRPTMIVGPGAPVFTSLAKLAGAPWVLVLGHGRARVQPVYVQDVAAAIRSILERDAFHGGILELGGPEVLTIEAFLREIRRTGFSRPERVIHIPLAPLAGILGVLEPFALRLLPFTAGQLESFRNDSTAAASPYFEQHRKAMRSPREVISLVFPHAPRSG